MMYKIIIAAFSLSFVVACSKRGFERAPVVDSQFSFSMVEKVVEISPRVPGTEKSGEFVRFLAEECSKYTASVTVDSFEDKTPVGTVLFQNVVAEIKGENDDEFIVVGSHFDTKIIAGIEIFSGANDGASSTGLLLAMMKAIKESAEIPPVTIRFVFFDGEECYDRYSKTDGLYGSRYYAETLSKSGELSDCKAVIILDMVGDKNLLLGLPGDTDPFLAKLAFSSAKHNNSLSHIAATKTIILDDHKPFQSKGVPCINLIDFDYGPNNVYWHTSYDSIDKISPDSLKIAGDLALGIIWAID